MKNIGKFVGKFARNMVGSVGCVSLIGLLGYYLSKGLNWVTDGIIKFLKTVAEYLEGNWVAVIGVVIVITLGSLLFEYIANRISSHIKERKAQKSQK